MVFPEEYDRWITNSEMTQLNPPSLLSFAHYIANLLVPIHKILYTGSVLSVKCSDSVLFKLNENQGTFYTFYMYQSLELAARAEAQGFFLCNSCNHETLNKSVCD